LNFASLRRLLRPETQDPRGGIAGIASQPDEAWLDLLTLNIEIVTAVDELQRPGSRFPSDQLLLESGAEGYMQHPRPELKYVAAKDLDQSASNFDGMEVDDPAGQKLGRVEGFILNVLDGAPRHIVVSAGWFIHKHFLLPIGHASMNVDGTKLVTDVAKDNVNKFPGFDKGEFEQLSQESLAKLDRTLADASGLVASLEIHYRVPVWWQATYYRIPVGDRRS
jgi:hypothetical protein